MLRRLASCAILLSFPTPQRPPFECRPGVIPGFSPELDRWRLWWRRHVMREEPRVRRWRRAIYVGPLRKDRVQFRAFFYAAAAPADRCILVERVTRTISRRRREAYSVVLRREIVVSIMELMVQDITRAHIRMGVDPVLVREPSDAEPRPFRHVRVIRPIPSDRELDGRALSD